MIQRPRGYFRQIHLQFQAAHRVLVKKGEEILSGIQLFGKGGMIC